MKIKNNKSVEEILYYWLPDFDMEVKKLFGSSLPKNYNINNFKIEPEFTPEEAAKQYFIAYLSV